MDTAQAIGERRSAHYFDPSRSIADAQLRELFDLVKLAPSGYNLQPWEFVVIRDADGKRRLRAAARDQKHVTDASAMVVVCGTLDPGRHAERVFADWVAKGYFPAETGKKMADQVRGWSAKPLEQRRVWTTRSTALAAMTLMLAAKDLGLASCPMEGFEPDKVAREFGVPSDYEVVMLIALGYELKPDLERKARRGYEEIVHIERFGARGR